MKFIYKEQTLSLEEFTTQVQNESARVEQTQELALLIACNAPITDIATFIGMEFQQFTPAKYEKNHIKDSQPLT